MPAPRRGRQDQAKARPNGGKPRPERQAKPMSIHGARLANGRGGPAIGSNTWRTRQSTRTSPSDWTGKEVCVGGETPATRWKISRDPQAKDLHGPAPARAASPRQVMKGTPPDSARDGAEAPSHRVDGINDLLLAQGCSRLHRQESRCRRRNGSIAGNKSAPLCRVLPVFEPAFAGGARLQGFALAQAYRVAPLKCEPHLVSVGSIRCAASRAQQGQPLYTTSAGG